MPCARTFLIRKSEAIISRAGGACQLKGPVKIYALFVLLLLFKGKHIDLWD
jgi:hypothetical protein